MEVQLHIHSQWVNAKIENEEILVTKKWNIGQLEKKDQIDLFNKSLDCLASIIKKSKKRNDLISFKAGSWGLQPFDILYKEFSKRGIKLVLGPIKGLKVPALNLDYSEMESGIVPYFCDENDINMIGRSKEIIVAPMTPTYLNWFDFFRYLIFMKLRKFKNKFDFDLDISKISKKISNLKPLAGKDKLSLSLKPFKTHLKINAQPYWYLKNTFERSYKMIMNTNNNFKLLIIETHTKDFKNNFIEINSFFNHLKNDYSNLKFITSTELLKHLGNKKNSIKTKK